MVTTMVEAESAWAIAVGDAISRELGGRSQRWLSRVTPYDAATINKIILGKQLPTLDQLDTIAKALGTTRRQLLTSAGYVEAPEGLNVDSLPPQARRLIQAIVREFEASVENSTHGSQDGN